MSDKKRFKREYVLPVALDLARRLRPLCTRLEVAGSLRRGKPEVADIELVYVPRPQDPLGELAGTDSMDARIMAMLNSGELARRPKKDGTWTWGPQNKLAIHTPTGIPVDLFATTEECWWMALVVRTGGADSNKALAMSAQRLGRKLLAYGPGVATVIGNGIMRPKSEQDVFEFCGVAYKRPEDR